MLHECCGGRKEQWDIGLLSFGKSYSHFIEFFGE
jgi:hypothetical protein